MHTYLKILPNVEEVPPLSDEHYPRELVPFRRIQEKSPMYDPHKRLPRMGHKTAPPRFSPLVRCLRSLRAHSGETSRWQPRGSVQVESDTDTVSDSEGSRSSDDRYGMAMVCFVL